MKKLQGGIINAALRPDFSSSMLLCVGLSGRGFRLFARLVVSFFRQFRSDGCGYLCGLELVALRCACKVRVFR